MSAQIEKTKNQLRGYARFTLNDVEVAQWAHAKWIMYSMCTIRGQQLKIEFNTFGVVRVVYDDHTSNPVYCGASVKDAVAAFNAELQ